MKTFQLFTGLHQKLLSVLNSTVVFWCFCTGLFLVVHNILLSWLAPSLLLLLWWLKRWNWLNKRRLRLLECWLWLVLRLLIRWLCLGRHIWILRLLFLREVVLRGLPLASWGLYDFVQVWLEFQVFHHISWYWALIRVLNRILMGLLFFFCRKGITSGWDLSRLETLEDGTCFAIGILASLLPLSRKRTKHSDHIDEMTSSPPCYCLRFSNCFTCKVVFVRSSKNRDHEIFDGCLHIVFVHVAHRLFHYFQVL